MTIARAIVQKLRFLFWMIQHQPLIMTESKLLTAIHEQLSDTTLILISQRTNSLKAADKILLLDKGHQLGFASHDELLASNELYRDIHYSQHQKGKED